MDELLQNAVQQAGEQFTTMVADIIAYSPTLLVGVLVGIIGIVISQALRRSGERLAHRIHAPRAAEQLIVNAIYVLSLILAVTVTLAVLGVEVGGLIAGLGVGGIAVGFALRDILENLLAGALLLIQRPFNIGDLVEVEDHLGHVQEIELRATTIKTLEGLAVVIPNRTVYNGILTNYSYYTHRRRQVTFGLAYEMNIAEGSQLILEAVRGVEGVADDPAPFVAMDEFGDSAITGNVFYYLNQREYDWGATHNRVLETVQETIDEYELDLPYPHQVILLKDQSKKEKVVSQPQKDVS